MLSKLQDSQELLHAIVEAEKIFLPPPVDEISPLATGTVMPDDEVSSVSSGQSEGQQRSIFGSFWNKNGGKEQSMRRSRPPSSIILHVAPDETSFSEDSCVLACADDASDNTYERALKAKEGARKVETRRIFGNSYRKSTSCPAMPAHFTDSTPFHKTRSEGGLDFNDAAAVPVSCLRLPKYSGMTRRKSCDSSTTSVRFDDSKTKVVAYAAPQEIWAAKGWSNYFH